MNKARPKQNASALKRVFCILLCFSLWNAGIPIDLHRLWSSEDWYSILESRLDAQQSNIPFIAVNQDIGKALKVVIESGYKKTIVQFVKDKLDELTLVLRSSPLNTVTDTLPKFVDTFVYNRELFEELGKYDIALFVSTMRIIWTGVLSVQSQAAVVESVNLGLLNLFGEKILSTSPVITKATVLNVSVIGAHQNYINGNFFKSAFDTAAFIGVTNILTVGDRYRNGSLSAAERRMYEESVRIQMRPLPVDNYIATLGTLLKQLSTTSYYAKLSTVVKTAIAFLEDSQLLVQPQYQELDFKGAMNRAFLAVREYTAAYIAKNKSGDLAKTLIPEKLQNETIEEWSVRSDERSLRARFFDGMCANAELVAKIRYLASFPPQCDPGDPSRCFAKFVAGAGDSICADGKFSKLSIKTQTDTIGKNVFPAVVRAIMEVDYRSENGVYPAGTLENDPEGSFSLALANAMGSIVPTPDVPEVAKVGNALIQNYKLLLPTTPESIGQAAGSIDSVFDSVFEEGELKVIPSQADLASSTEHHMRMMQLKLIGNAGITLKSLIENLEPLQEAITSQMNLMRARTQVERWLASGVSGAVPAEMQPPIKDKTNGYFVFLPKLIPTAKFSIPFELNISPDDFERQRNSFPKQRRAEWTNSAEGLTLLVKKGEAGALEALNDQIYNGIVRMRALIMRKNRALCSAMEANRSLEMFRAAVDAQAETVISIASRMKSLPGQYFVSKTIPSINYTVDLFPNFGAFRTLGAVLDAFARSGETVQLITNATGEPSAFRVPGISQGLVDPDLGNTPTYQRLEDSLFRDSDLKNFELNANERRWVRRIFCLDYEVSESGREKGMCISETGVIADEKVKRAVNALFLARLFEQPSEAVLESSCNLKNRAGILGNAAQGLGFAIQKSVIAPAYGQMQNLLANRMKEKIENVVSSQVLLNAQRGGMQAIFMKPNADYLAAIDNCKQNNLMKIFARHYGMGYGAGFTMGESYGNTFLEFMQLSRGVSLESHPVHALFIGSWYVNNRGMGEGVVQFTLPVLDQTKNYLENAGLNANAVLANTDYGSNAPSAVANKWAASPEWQKHLVRNSNILASLKRLVARSNVGWRLDQLDFSLINLVDKSEDVPGSSINDFLQDLRAIWGVGRYNASSGAYAAFAYDIEAAAVQAAENYRLQLSLTGADSYLLDWGIGILANGTPKEIFSPIPEQNTSSADISKMVLQAAMRGEAAQLPSHGQASWLPQRLFPQLHAPNSDLPNPHYFLMALSQRAFVPALNGGPGGSSVWDWNRDLVAKAGRPMRFIDDNNPEFSGRGEIIYARPPRMKNVMVAFQEGAERTFLSGGLTEFLKKAVFRHVNDVKGNLQLSYETLQHVTYSAFATHRLYTQYTLPESLKSYQLTATPGASVTYRNESYYGFQDTACDRDSIPVDHQMYSLLNPEDGARWCPGLQNLMAVIGLMQRLSFDLLRYGSLHVNVGDLQSLAVNTAKAKEIVDRRSALATFFKSFEPESNPALFKNGANFLCEVPVGERCEATAFQLGQAKSKVVGSFGETLAGTGVSYANSWSTAKALRFKLVMIASYTTAVFTLAAFGIGAGVVGTAATISRSVGASGWSLWGSRALMFGGLALQEIEQIIILAGFVTLGEVVSASIQDAVHNSQHPGDPRATDSIALNKRIDGGLGVAITHHLFARGIGGGIGRISTRFTGTAEPVSTFGRFVQRGFVGLGSVSLNTVFHKLFFSQEDSWDSVAMQSFSAGVSAMPFDDLAIMLVAPRGLSSLLLTYPIAYTFNAVTSMGGGAIRFIIKPANSQTAHGEQFDDAFQAALYELWSPVMDARASWHSSKDAKKILFAAKAQQVKSTLAGSEEDIGVRVSAYARLAADPSFKEPRFFGPLIAERLLNEQGTLAAISGSESWITSNPILKNSLQLKNAIFDAKAIQESLMKAFKMSANEVQIWMNRQVREE